MDIFRDSDISRQFDLAKNKAADIEAYEAKVVEKYNGLDLYRMKGISHRKISFNDLTLEENLSYIKYDLKNTHEAFKLFDITKEKFAEAPEIAASLI